MSPDKQVPTRTSNIPTCKRNVNASPNPTKPTTKKHPESPSNSTAQQKSPDILIFSNSMCKKIDEHRFYRGKSTKVSAKSGATIPDVQKMVKDSEYKDPEFVVLQAWTNTASRESTEDCIKKARSLIDSTLTKFPAAQIIISGILPRLVPLTSRNNTNRTILELNDFLEHNCRNNNRLSFVDHSQSFVENRQIREELYWDHIHMNNRGLGRFMFNLRKTINHLSYMYVNPIWPPQPPKT
jgi:hypothetical protein